MYLDLVFSIITLSFLISIMIGNISFSLTRIENPEKMYNRIMHLLIVAASFHLFLISIYVQNYFINVFEYINILVMFGGGGSIFFLVISIPNLYLGIIGQKKIHFILSEIRMRNNLIDRLKKTSTVLPLILVIGFQFFLAEFFLLSSALIIYNKLNL